MRVESRGVQTCPLLPGCIGFFRWFVYIHIYIYNVLLEQFDHLKHRFVLRLNHFRSWTTSLLCWIIWMPTERCSLCLPWPATSDCFSPACCQSPTLSLAYASISDEGIVEATSKQGVLLLAERNIVTLAGGVQVPPWQSLCKVRSLDFGGLIPRKFGNVSNAGLKLFVSNRQPSLLWFLIESLRLPNCSHSFEKSSVLKVQSEFS